MAKKSATLRIDFSKEEESGGGGRVRWPEGDYHVKIVKVATGRSSEKDTPYLEVHFQCLSGKKKGKTVSDRFYITPKSLKRVRLLLEAVGVSVPKKAVNIPLGKLKGKTLWIELEDEEREGYDARSRVAFEGFMSEDDYEAEDSDDEDDDDEDDDDLDDDEDDDEDDEDDEDEEDDDEDEDDEDDEEEEPAPKKRSRSKAKPAAKPKAKTKGRKKKADDDDDEIEDLDLDEL